MWCRQCQNRVDLGRDDEFVELFVTLMHIRLPQALLVFLLTKIENVQYTSFRQQNISAIRWMLVDDVLLWPMDRAHTVDGNFSAVTLFSRVSWKASSPRRYHDRDFESCYIVYILEYHRNPVLAFQPPKIKPRFEKLTEPRRICFDRKVAIYNICLYYY